MSDYAITLIAEAPAATVESVHSELLPLVKAHGFVDLQLSHTYTRAGGHVYTAAAVRWDDTVQMLAYSYQSLTLEHLQAVARQALASLDAATAYIQL